VLAVSVLEQEKKEGLIFFFFDSMRDLGKALHVTVELCRVRCRLI